MTNKRIPYEPPQARDLSGLSVRGKAPRYPCVNGLIAQDPGDPCTGGGQATGLCEVGLFFAGPAPCTPGGAPQGLECITGGDAGNSLCTSGNNFVP
jgi:hypothetical protein